MIDHSPALIAAAKAIELRVFGYDHPDDRICAALCEALSTTPSEEPMKQKRDLSECQSAFDVIANAAKPEPSEDHLRRACKLCGEKYDTFASGKLSTRYADNVHTVARLLAEREAMQTRVEGPVYRHKKRGTIYTVIGEGKLQCSANELLDDAPVVIYRGEDGQLWVRGVQEFHDGRFEPAEPTPDPDLVLAREAAAQNANLIASAKQDLRDGKWDDHEGVQSALRALKLAKEQG